MQSNKKRIRIDYAPLNVAYSVQCTTPTSTALQVFNAAEGQYEPDREISPSQFWPEIEKCFAGVRRTLKDGGHFVIVNEDDGLSGNNEKWKKLIDGMHTYTPDELHTHLTAAGFHDITVRRDEQRHWLRVMAENHHLPRLTRRRELNKDCDE